MNILVIGLGLIGGSFALASRQNGHTVIGVESNEPNAAKALELGLVAEILSLDNGLGSAHLIVLATPVNVIERLLKELLQKLVEDQILIDLGSTKSSMARSVENHANRSRYVACHPMAGTEFSGPAAALPDLFKNTFMVICDRDKSDSKALKTVEGLFENFGMEIVYYDSASHDRHAAYISHVSHVTSFALALTVLEKEKNEEDIFRLAAGGFTSTVRLAKSNPHTWASIFLKNREALIDVITENTHQLELFKSALVNQDEHALLALMQRANAIKKII